MLKYSHKKQVANSPLKAQRPVTSWASAAGRPTNGVPPLIDKEIVAQENQLITESQVTRLCEENHIRRLEENLIFSRLFFVGRGAEFRT